MILLKKECFELSMNGKSRMISTAPPPFVLRRSKDERWVFQRNHKMNFDSLTKRR
jgi:hypothetical protein